MQVGCCLNMLSRTSTGIGHEYVGIAREVGFDYVELPLAQVMLLDDDAFKHGPLAAIKSAGIPCLRMNNFLPSSLRLTGPDAHHEKALAYVASALDRAQMLGVRVVVMGSAGARNRPLYTSLKDAENQLADFLEGVAPLAQQRDITIAIEHLNRFESNMVNSYAEGSALARRVNHPAVGTLLDTYHMDMVGETLSCIRGDGKMLKHIHVARALHRSFPRQGDEGDYASLILALENIGYNETLSIEANVQKDFVAEATEALQHLRNYMH